MAKYRVFCKLCTASRVAVVVEAASKKDAEYQALEEVRAHVCEGEAEPYWAVCPSYTRRVKENGKELKDGE